MEKNRNILRLIAVGLLLSIIIIGIACPSRKKSKDIAVGTSTPPPSAPSGNWSRLAAGNDYTISLKTTGTLWGWGKGTDLTPRQIDTNTDWSTLAEGWFHTLSLKTIGTLWAWGTNYYGELGLGDTINRNTPSQIGTASDWSRFAAGAYHTLGLKTTATLWSWGLNNYGQLGLGYTLPFGSGVNTPTQIGTNSEWSAVAGGAWHSLGIKTNQTLWAWGLNTDGQLGLGVTDFFITTPSQIGTASDWLVISGTNLSGLAAGGSHTLGIKTNRTLWAWGMSSSGQLGLGDIIYTTTPTQVGTASDWSALAAGAEHTISLKTNGTLWSWGGGNISSNYGQLGLGDYDNRNTPSQIGTASDWSAFTAGVYHTLGIKTNGTIWAWGWNYFGQLGLGDTIDRWTPTMIGE